MLRDIRGGVAGWGQQWGLVGPKGDNVGGRAGRHACPAQEFLPVGRARAPAGTTVPGHAAHQPAGGGARRAYLHSTQHKRRVCYIKG